MSFSRIADQIREIHRICGEWDDSALGDTIQRPRWTRWFRFLYALIGFGVLLGMIGILSRIEVATPLSLHLEIGLMWGILGLWGAYCVVATGIDFYYLWLELREMGAPVSKQDLEEIGDWLAFDRRLLAFGDPVLDIAAHWLEARAKRIENVRLFLIGLSTLGTGVLGFLLWSGSPLRSWLGQYLAGNWLVAAQFWTFCVLVGGVLAIGAGWYRGIRCANRALTLRRIIATRQSYTDHNPHSEQEGV